MTHVSHKLSNAFQGALAGGGDPATSPLYVFGPFLKLIVVAGVADVTFGDIMRWGLVRRAEAVVSVSVRTVWTGTQAEYDALTPDPDTLYFIQ